MAHYRSHTTDPFSMDGTLKKRFRYIYVILFPRAAWQH